MKNTVKVMVKKLEEYEWSRRTFTNITNSITGLGESGYTLLSY